MKIINKPVLYENTFLECPKSSRTISLHETDESEALAIERLGASIIEATIIDYGDELVAHSISDWAKLSLKINPDFSCEALYEYLDSIAEDGKVAINIGDPGLRSHGPWIHIVIVDAKHEDLLIDAIEDAEIRAEEGD